MYKIILILPLFVGTMLYGQNHSPEDTDFLGASKKFEFYSSYWFNMHHFLYFEAVFRAEKDSSVIPRPLFSKMLPKEQQVVNETISFYQKEMMPKDLRSDDYMASFKTWITASNKLPSNIPASFSQHIEILQAFAPIYQTYFWPEHKRQNTNLLNENLELVLQTEEVAVQRLSLLTRQYWQDEKIRVDLVSYGKIDAWNMKSRPYTSLEPTHIVMNTKEGDHPRGNWLELLYHEASHNLIGGNRGFVGGTILDAEEVLGIKAPRSLWHAYLFYFSGIVTKELLNEYGFNNYELYMIRNNMFSRYFSTLETFLSAYVDRKTSLFEATKKIMEAQK